MSERPSERLRTRWAPGAQQMADAARLVSGVVDEGRSARDALAALGTRADRAAVQAVALGTLRWFLRLEPALAPLLAPGRRAPLPALRALLIVAAHQIEYSTHPAQLTVHAAVDATRVLGEPRASGLVNAVLRRFVAERRLLFARVDSDPAGASAHPAWLVQSLERAWPRALPRILAAGNAHPPLVVRVDRSRTQRQDYLGELASAGLAGEPLEVAPDAVRLAHAVPVRELPGFAEGRISVQDAGAQLAAPLLAAERGMRVLDACAAPGGKTVHLLELADDALDLLAIDVDGGRLGRIEENLVRTRRHARLAVLDARTLAPGLPAPAGGPFDRVLVDAPCSATGVIRRHPDIKLLRRPSDLAGFAAIQREILAAGFRVLAPGGRLLYCTCSILPQENEELVQAFLDAEPHARPVPLPPPERFAPGGVARPVGVQLLPGGAADTDGFYYACLEKTTAGN